MINGIAYARSFRLCNDEVLAREKSKAVPDLENRDFYLW